MPRISRKILTFILLVMFFALTVSKNTILDISITKNLQNPESSSIPGYYLSNGGAWYQKHGDYVVLAIKVESPTKPYPTAVIAIVNGTNTLMHLRGFSEDSYLIKNDIKTGAYYAAYLLSPQVGFYQVKFGACDSDLIWNYSNNYTFTKSPLTIYHDISNTWSENLHTNVYRFMISFFNHYITPYQVWVQIDNQNYTMTYNSVSSRYEYTHDFGLDDNGTHYFNYTIYSPTIENYQITGTSELELDIIERKPYIDMWHWYFDTESEIPKLVIFPSYQNWENVPPNQILVEVNGTNHTTSKIPYYHKFNSTYFLNYDSLDWRRPFPLQEFNISVSNNSRYNVTLWAQNSTGDWVSTSIKEDELFQYYDQSAITMTVVNKSIYAIGTYTYVNLTIDLQSDLSLTLASTYGYFYYSTTPYMTSFLMEQVNPSDTDFSDGKRFKLNTIIYNSPNRLWGNVAFCISFTYNIPPFQKIWLSEFEEISGTPGAVGEYGVKAGDILSYNYTYCNTLSCCNQIIQLQRDIVINKIGRTLGSDYIEYYYIDYPIGEEKVSREDYIEYYALENRLEQGSNPFITPGMYFQFIEPDFPVSYWSFPYVVPKNKLSDLCTYLNNYSNVSNIFTLNGRSIVGNESGNTYDYRFLLEYNANFTLERKQFNVTYGPCRHVSFEFLRTYPLIEEPEAPEEPDNGEIEDRDKFDPALLATIIIIPAVNVGGLVGYLLLRKKIKPQIKK